MRKLEKHEEPKTVTTKRKMFSDRTAGNYFKRSYADPFGN